VRNEADRESGVTYIGPRSFVAGFAVICGVLLAVGFGATRITESIEAPAPIAAAQRAPALWTTSAPTPATTGAPVTVNASIGGTANASIGGTTPILASAIVPPFSAARDSSARPPSTSPVDSRMSRAAAPVARPVGGTASSAISAAPVTSLQHPTAARIGRVMSNAPPQHIPGPTPNTAAHLAATPLSNPSYSPHQLRARPTPAQVVPPPAGILVPFKAAALTSNSALEPRSVGGAPLVINPAPAPAASPPSGTPSLR